MSVGENSFWFSKVGLDLRTSVFRILLVEFLSHPFVFIFLEPELIRHNSNLNNINWGQGAYLVAVLMENGSDNFGNKYCIARWPPEP